MPENAHRLSREAVFTAREPSRIADGRFTIRQRWSRARRSLDAATEAGERMPLLIGDAAREVTKLVAWALVRDIRIDDGVTTVTYESVRPLRGRSATELAKLSDGKTISPGYLKAYVPCETPKFLFAGTADGAGDAPVEDLELSALQSVEASSRILLKAGGGEHRTTRPCLNGQWTSA